MTFSGVKDLVDESYTAGKTQYTTFRKVPAIASVGGNWIDLSMAPGNPRPNYYTADERTAAVLSATRGLYHGGAVGPETKHLHKLGLAALNAGVVPATVVLCDYLLFYPLIDMDNDAPQALYNYADNPLIPALPRYADGEGVKAFLVASNPYIGGPAFNLTYTNSRGESGRVSAGMVTNQSTYIGTIINAGLTAGVRGPFIDLCPGDTGIRSVQSVQFAGPAGGLAVLVLVKPLATLLIREITTWAEFDFTLHKPSLPRIYDGAYLNFLCMPTGNVSGQAIIGEATFIWG
jgi:hypothetical protein